jgi:hypothetical protein
VLGASPLVIGWFGFLENAVGAAYALPGGYLTDRMGHKRALFLFALLNLAGYALLAVPYWPMVLVATTLCMAWSQLSLPATFSLVAEQLPRQKRVMGLAVQAIIRRVPMGVGPVLGGMVFTALGIVMGMPFVLAAAALLTLIAVGLHLRLSRHDERQAPHEPLHPVKLWRTFRPELRRLLLSDILIRFCEQIPNAYVVLWVIDRVNRSEVEFGWLTAIEMATAASLYIPVALWADARVRDDSAARPDGAPLMLATERKPFVVATFCFFAAFPAVLYFSDGIWMLVVAFIVRGFKEFGEPSRKATIVDLAVEGAKARTVGLYYFLRDIVVAFAALAGGWLWSIDPALNLRVAFGFGILGTLVYAFSRQDHNPAR